MSTKRTATMEAEPLHLVGPDEGPLTLCGAMAARVPVAPATHARRTWAGKKCDACFALAGLSERKRPTRTKAEGGPWEQLSLWS